MRLSKESWDNRIIGSLTDNRESITDLSVR